MQLEKDEYITYREGNRIWWELAKAGTYICTLEDFRLIDSFPWWKRLLMIFIP